MQSKLVIGIDVSNKELDCVEGTSELTVDQLRKTSVRKVVNEVESVSQFLDEYQGQDPLVVFEATGTYSDKLQSLLAEKGIRYSQVNPKRGSHFFNSLGVDIKTDKTSARLLTFMGLRFDLALYSPPSEGMKQRKQLLQALCGLEKSRQSLKNQLHAQEQYRYPNLTVIKAFEALIEEIDGKIKDLQQDLDSLEDEAFKEAKRLVMSIKGLGPVTAYWLLVLTNNLKDFQDARQLIKYCGLNPAKHYSGTSVHKEKGITKQASAKLRAALYMGAKSAIRYNAACRDLYLRLRKKGKCYFKAIVAVMAKLLKQAFGVIKSGKEYDDNYYLQFKKN